MIHVAVRWNITTHLLGGWNKHLLAGVVGPRVRLTGRRERREERYALSLPLSPLSSYLTTWLTHLLPRSILPDINNPCHIPPEEMIGQKVVTIKTVCSIKTFGFWWYKKHEFQNTFHQPFGRYGNPDRHFLRPLKFNFQILKVFWVLILNLSIIFNFRVIIWILLLVKT